jgi:mono/diheme cytochrome c family protein
VLVRGQERFNIFCAPCHDRAGTGNGMVVQRGFKKPVSFHDPRLRGVAVGYFVNNITMGFGQMPSYAAQIPVADRWAIAAYVRPCS